MISYADASKRFSEACAAEGIPEHRLGLMSEETRRLWREKQKAGNRLIEHECWEASNW